MQPPITSPNKTLPAFELKGSLFTLTVLHLLNANPQAFIDELRRHAQHTPNLFKNMPVIIDLERINAQRTDEEEAQVVDFAALRHQLKQHGLIPVGIRHGNEAQNLAAENAGLPLLSSQSSASDTASKPKQPRQSEKKSPDAAHTMVV